MGRRRSDRNWLNDFPTGAESVIFINGVFVGFLLGILYAPDRGEETRRKISQRASDIKDTVKSTYNEVAGTVSSQMDQVKIKRVN